MTNEIYMYIVIWCDDDVNVIGFSQYPKYKSNLSVFLVCAVSQDPELVMQSLDT